MNFVIKPFSNTTALISVLRDKDFGTFKDFSTASNKHFSYMEKYFRHESVKTLVFEFEYTDKDFIEDYSRYYSRCLKPYSKSCVRIHAFRTSFDEDDFVALLQRGPTSLTIGKLRQNYIGFYILRPIPHTPFGRTCLCTYTDDEDAKNRSFPITRNYKVHLYGIELSVKSLAFQEQDKAVSACATSALWSAFQGTGILFHHHIPSPYEITLKATEVAIHYFNRSFPNKGLVPQQIAHAIRSVGLEPLLVNVSNYTFFKAYLNAYLKGGIPVIMSMELYPYEDGERKESKGLHAVTVTGFYMLSKDEFVDQKKEPVSLLSSRISKLYVHDDQIGPFAKMELDESDGTKMTLSTTWAEFESIPKDNYEIRALPTTLYIPAYHKIRVPFLVINEIIESFTNQLCKPVVKDFYLVWDIYLSTVADLKEKIFQNDSLLPQDRLAFLTETLPKYIWIADAYENDKLSFSFYFDATDIENGYLFLGSLHYFPISHREQFKALAEVFLEDPRITFHCKEILSYYM